MGKLLETIDITVIAALVTVIVAVVSPVCVAHITRRGKYQATSLELFFHAKTEAYRDLLRIASTFPQSPTDEDAVKLNQAINYAMLFSSENTCSALARLGQILVHGPITPDTLNAFVLANQAAILAMQNEIQQYKYETRKSKRKRNRD